MYTLGFSFGYSDVAIADTPFILPTGVSASTYIIVIGTEGTLVYTNSIGQTQVTHAFLGYNPIAATQILSTGIVNGVMYTTTASGFFWGGSGSF